MTIDRRRLRRSTVKPQIAAAYHAGALVKNIIADFGCHYSSLYRALDEFGIPRRQPARAQAIRTALGRAAASG